jgi:ribonuclease HI
MKLTLQTDGGSRGNPGPSATGIVLKDEQGKIVSAYGEYLGIQTNNIAEYSALLSGIKKALELGADEIECILDSELVVKQMRREYKVRNPALQKLFIQIYNLTLKLKKISFSHTLRAGNKEADAEVNKVLDTRHGR